MISALVDCLALFYQAGNLAQVEAVATTMLAAIPDDLVALQFLGLVFYETGRFDDAHQAFRRVAAGIRQPREAAGDSVCERAGIATLREAIRPQSGLAEGWLRIAEILSRFGFADASARAFEFARSARAQG